MRILLVDDDQMIIRGVAGIINRMELDGIKIITAYNAPDALELLKHEGADLIITDVEMPVMNGLELIAEARKRGYCGNVLILSGFDSFGFVRTALRYQVADYLLKPIDKTALQDLINGFYYEKHKPLKINEVETVEGFDIYLAEPKELPERFAAILRYMRENYMTDLSLEKISEELGVHPNYICSLFNKLMDTTFLHYLDCLRLRKSVEQLLNRREMPVQEIAAVSGFMNERQFYKVFKKRLGLTPGAFRKQYEGTRIKTPS